MNYSLSSPIERLALDPIYQHAHKVADNILTSTRGGPDRITEYRDQLQRYLSSTQRIRFLDAFRKELMVVIDEHRKVCPQVVDPQKCMQEQRYAQIVLAIQDDLEVLNPAIASRATGGSFTQVEADTINQEFSQLLEHLQALRDDMTSIKLGQQVTYDDVIDLLEEMRTKLPYGKRDWQDLFAHRLAALGFDEGMKKMLVDPVFQELSRILQ